MSTSVFTEVDFCIESYIFEWYNHKTECIKYIIDF